VLAEAAVAGPRKRWSGRNGDGQDEGVDETTVAAVDTDTVAETVTETMTNSVAETPFAMYYLFS
jgi:hypothetical protein